MPKVPKKTAKATSRGGPLARSSGNVSKKPSGQYKRPCHPTCFTCHILSCTISVLVHDDLVCSASIFLISRRIPSVLVPWLFHAPRLTQASQRNSKRQARSPTSPCRGPQDSFHVQRASQCFRSGFRAQLSPPSPPYGHLLSNNPTHPLSAWVL